MEKKNEIFDLCPSIKELSNKDLKIVNGGRIAYDIGFLFRETIVYIINGGGGSGVISASLDFCVNYKPEN